LNEHNKEITASPVTRRYAAENDIELDDIVGTGPDGMITMADISAKVDGSVVEQTEADTSESHQELEESESLVAREPQMSVGVTTFQIEFSSVVSHRERFKDQYAKHGVRLTFSSYLILAMSRSIKKYPQLYTSQDGSSIDSEVDLAVWFEDGNGSQMKLLKGIEALSLTGVASRLEAIVRISEDDLQDDNFSDSRIVFVNSNHLGSYSSVPALPANKNCLITLGSVEERVFVSEDGSIDHKPQSFVSLCYDASIVDPFKADGFLADVKSRIENWNG